MKRNKSPKYRIVDVDPTHNVFSLERQIFWFIWENVKVGARQELEAYIKASKI
jgi:hypothetical protein